jgi:hypothetical protein
MSGSSEDAIVRFAERQKWITPCAETAAHDVVRPLQNLGPDADKIRDSSPDSTRDPENRPVPARDERAQREKNLDKTLADSFPTSDPPSTLPDPSGQF